MVVMWGMLIELGGVGLYFIVDYMHMVFQSYLQYWKRGMERVWDAR